MRSVRVGSAQAILRYQQGQIPAYLHGYNFNLLADSNAKTRSPGVSALSKPPIFSLNFYRFEACLPALGLQSPEGSVRHFLLFCAS
jgi:hypothetical protein